MAVLKVWSSVSNSRKECKMPFLSKKTGEGRKKGEGPGKVEDPEDGVGGDGLLVKGKRAGVVVVDLGTAKLAAITLTHQ